MVFPSLGHKGGRAEERVTDAGVVTVLSGTETALLLSSGSVDYVKRSEGVVQAKARD